MTAADRRVALITGGGGGIGREIALRFARDGLCVAVLDRDGDAATAVAAELAGLALTADVTDATEVTDAIDAALAHFGRIDVLVNNAGICWTGPALDMPLAALRHMLQVN